MLIISGGFTGWDCCQEGQREVAKSKGEKSWWQKYTLTLEEAAEYFGVGYKKLRMFCKEHANEVFILWNGNRSLIKREQFEKYMDSYMNVI